MLPKFLRLPKLSVLCSPWRRLSLNVRKQVTLAGLLALALTGAFCWGRFGAANLARGQSPRQTALDPNLLQKAVRGDPGHVVAFIYGDVPVTREELGEYLVQRVGTDRLELLINRKIIEKACAAKGIHISEAEITGQLAHELQTVYKCTEREFVNNLLRSHNKTLFEYREDAIWPKLALQRFVQDSIVVSEDDIRKGFEARFGPKVECRLIALSKEQAKDKYDVWQRASKGLTEFEKEAMTYNIPGPLQAQAGKVPPIHLHFGDFNIEKAAFNLKPGDCSPLIGMDDGSSVILHCIQHIPAEPNKSLDQERLAIHQEIFEARVAEAVKTVFAELRKQADPHLFLRRESVPSAAQAPATAGPQPAAPASPLPSSGEVVQPPPPPKD